MGPRRVVVTDQVFPSLDIERDLLAGVGATIEVAAGDRDEVLGVASRAEALLNTYFALDAEALARLGRCRVIARYGIGVDNIDLEAAAARGIVVTNVPDYCIEEVATHALALILALVRRVPEGDAQVRRGAWGIDGLRPIQRMSETVVGLLGLGRIGRRLAGLVRATGAPVVAFDPYADAADGVTLASLDEVLRTADVVSLHCPLTDETRGLIGAEELASMKFSAVLVNTSRGPLVVLDDLLAALRTGVIRAAALDVFEHEPPDPDVLADVPGLLATPHAAFYSEASLRESQRKAATQIVKVLRGETPDYAVNAPR